MSREEIGVAAVAWGSWGMGSREGFVTLGRVQYPLRYLALFFFLIQKSMEQGSIRAVSIWVWQ